MHSLFVVLLTKNICNRETYQARKSLHSAPGLAMDEGYGSAYPLILLAVKDFQSILLGAIIQI
jgi:hypothetical protein